MWIPSGGSVYPYWKYLLQLIQLVYCYYMSECVMFKRKVQNLQYKYKEC